MWTHQSVGRLWPSMGCCAKNYFLLLWVYSTNDAKRIVLFKLEETLIHLKQGWTDVKRWKSKLPAEKSASY